MMKKLFIGAMALMMVLAAQGQKRDYSKYYTNLPVMMAQVTAPQIPANDVNLIEVGGIGDGVMLNTKAFEDGIKKLQKMGGGRLIVPQGVWLTGPIQLKDNIELHLEKNAIILMSPDKSLFVNEKQPGSKCIVGIRASKRKNIAITGEGIIDGNGDHWRPVKRMKVSDVEWNKYKNVIGGVEKDGGKLFYPFDDLAGYPNIADSPEKQEKLRVDLVRFESCENVLVEGVTIQNAPKFHLHPCFSKNVIVDGVTVRCSWNAQNGDAIDFSDVNIGLIVNSTVDAGDDGICMKSGKYKDAPANGCEDILIQDNTVYHAHGGFVLGSETQQGMRRIVVRDCRFSGTDSGLRFKSGLGRGGKTEQMYISDIVMTDIKDDAVVFQCDYVDRPAGSDPNAVPTFTEEQKKVAPFFQDIHIDNVICRGCHNGIKAAGILGLDNVKDIDIRNSTFVYRKTAKKIDEATAKLNLVNVRMIKEGITK